MLDILYKISIWILALLLLTLIVLISIVGVDESVLHTIGWVTSFFILSSAVLYYVRRRKK